MRYETTRQNIFLAYPLHRSTLLLMLTQCFKPSFKCVFSGVLCRFIREEIYYFLLSTQQNNEKERRKIFRSHMERTRSRHAKKKTKILYEQKKATEKMVVGKKKYQPMYVRHLEKKRSLQQ